MAVTIRDVARAAGVSVSTVSRVLNNKGTISEETKKRIHEAMEAVSYTHLDVYKRQGFTNHSQHCCPGLLIV